jgi:hypothetical protein
MRNSPTARVRVLIAKLSRLRIKISFQAAGKEDASPLNRALNEQVKDKGVALSDRAAFTPSEFAALFGKSYVWGYRQIYAGKVKVISDMGRMLISREEVERIRCKGTIYSGKK